MSVFAVDKVMQVKVCCHRVKPSAALQQPKEGASSLPGNPFAAVPIRLGKSIATSLGCDRGRPLSPTRLNENLS